MKVAIFYDPQNTFIGTIGPQASGWFKRDGATFKRWAEHAGSYYTTTDLYEIHGKNAFEKRQNLFRDLEGLEALEQQYGRIMFFCHGHPRALNRKMIRMAKGKFKGNVGKFCDKLKAISAPGCKIVFWSCKTATVKNGKGGFAAEVAYDTDCDVIGHTTSGHTTLNPYKSIIGWSRYEHSGNRKMFSDVALWPKHGGIRALKKQLLKSKTAPFYFVESVWGE